MSQDLGRAAEFQPNGANNVAGTNDSANLVPSEWSSPAGQNYRNNDSLSTDFSQDLRPSSLPPVDTNAPDSVSSTPQQSDRSVVQDNPYEQPQPNQPTEVPQGQRPTGRHHHADQTQVYQPTDTPHTKSLPKVHIVGPQWDRYKRIIKDTTVSGVTSEYKYEGKASNAPMVAFTMRDHDGTLIKQGSFDSRTGRWMITPPSQGDDQIARVDLDQRTGVRTETHQTRMGWYQTWMDDQDRCYTGYPNGSMVITERGPDGHARLLEQQIRSGNNVDQILYTYTPDGKMNVSDRDLTGSTTQLIANGSPKDQVFLAYDQKGGVNIREKDLNGNEKVIMYRSPKPEGITTFYQYNDAGNLATEYSTFTNGVSVRMSYNEETKKWGQNRIDYRDPKNPNVVYRLQPDQDGNWRRYEIAPSADGTHWEVYGNSLLSRDSKHTPIKSVAVDKNGLIHVL